MELQRFVTNVIEGFGGMVVPVEYALCHVLIPEEYKGYFQNKSEFELSFDYEVAQENPSSEFVTFGSFVLEQVLEIAHKKAVSTMRFAEIERLTLAYPLKKIHQYLQDDAGKPHIVSETKVMGIWAVYQFQIAFVSDEKELRSEQVWVNLITGKVCRTMKQEQHRIVYHNEPVYTYPLAEEFNIFDGYEVAYDHIRQNTESERKQRSQETSIKKDLERIESYYQELLSENGRKASRKGISHDKKQNLLKKATAIELEKNKQIQEIKDKYNEKIEVSLDHGILYFIPLLKYKIESHFRSTKKERTLYHNPITKQFDD
ncbi:hypothetical protein [Bacillus sp. 2205SS5-2]|uniref:hypothetical protein n=1 Tax=Bacillus sp. 2205SS5-2 TaxID=3109031 RepID=UPI003003F0D2